jgi:hypothetical protein
MSSIYQLTREAQELASLLSEGEIWRDIEGFEGKYQISNLGDVKSLKRKVFYKNGVIREIKEKKLKPVLDSYGYLIVCLHNEDYNGNKFHKNKKIHRLVCENFYLKDEERLGVNHINCIKTDNRLKNLEFVSSKENSVHASKNGLLKNMFVSNKLTKEQAFKIKYDSKEFSTRFLSEKYNVSYGTIYAIRNNLNWKEL